MVGFLTVLLLLFPDSDDSLILEMDGHLPMYNLKAEVVRDGSFLVTTPRAIFHWNSDGRLIHRLNVKDHIDFEEDIFISTFAYDVRKGVYWIVDGLSHYSFFIDREGNYLGKNMALYPKSDKPIFIRDLLVAGSRVFAMDGSIYQGAWADNDRGLFQQVAWSMSEEGPIINLVGESFGRPTAIQKEYSYDFKRHWLVQDGFNKNFFVVNQLSTEVQVFTAQSIDSGMLSSGKTVPLIMAGWKVTPSRLNGLPRPHADQYNTISQIKGFCPVGNDLLVAWSIPDPQNPDSRVLGLQRFGKQGLLRGQPLRAEGAFLGVHDGFAYILDGDRNTEKPVYRVRKLAL